MPNIRIKDIPTTASATSSTDFIGIDGSANGTRKLNAYSPTFGGNLTVSGTGTSSVAGVFKAGTDIVTGDTSAFQVHNNVDDKPMVGFYRGGTLRSVLRLNTDNDFRLLSSDLSTPANLTAGNLTVSGTGASTVNGNLLITGTTNYTRIRRDDTIIDFTNAAQSAYANAQIIANNLHLKGNNGTGIYVNSSGNGLFGTTTDSSNGRIQLATHTTSAGGIGFGTDTSLYRSAAGQLRGPSSFIDATFASSGLFFGASMTLQANDNVLIKTNGSVTALTLDSSQNATFAGNTTAKGTTHYFGADNSQRIELTSNNGSSQGLVEFYNRGTSAYFAARYLASSHTFEQGPIAINNTVQTAAGVSSTHKVTISIGGTTYYLLATNV